MTDDTELLRRYAEEGSEAAFAEFVQRHIARVYAAALRRTNGDTHRAVEVSQLVFTDAARRARSLSRHAVVSAWLYVATRNAAFNLKRAEARRSKREQEAQTMNQTLGMDEPAADLERLRPVLDAAMDELSGADREAVLLRFFEDQPFAAIGVRLRLTENAARMRVERALDRLRTQLTRRGVTSTAAALAVALANQAAVAAPAGLAATVSGVALANAAQVGGALGVTLKGIFTMTTISKVAIALVLIVAAAVPTYYWFQPATELRRQADTVLAPRTTPEEKTPFQVDTPPMGPLANTAPMVPNGTHDVFGAIVAKLPVRGVVMTGGTFELVIGKVHLKSGDNFAVTYNSHDYQLRVIAITSNTFTLGLDGEEITRTLRGG